MNPTLLLFFLPHTTISLHCILVYSLHCSGLRTSQFHSLFMSHIVHFTPCPISTFISQLINFTLFTSHHVLLHLIHFIPCQFHILFILHPVHFTLVFISHHMYFTPCSLHTNVLSHLVHFTSCSFHTLFISPSIVQLHVYLGHFHFTHYSFHTFSFHT